MDGYVTIGTKLDSSMIDKEISLLEERLDGLLEEYDALEKAKPFEGQNKELLKLNREIETTRKKLNKLNNSRIDKLKSSIDNVGSNISKVIKNVAKWGLAIFGIQSIYNGIKSAMHTIASQDEQLGADIEYMKNALAYAIEPIVRGIVDLAKQLMFYVGYIIKAWTGKNIFENANKSLKSANGQAKQLKKTLSSFDEMNILSDNSSSSSGGATMPSFDLSNQDNMPVPEWIKWIAENKDVLLAAFWGIAGAITAMKLSQFAESLGLVGGHLSFIKGLGIAAIIFGLIELLTDLINIYDKVDGSLENNGTSFEDWGNILIDIGIIILGIAALIASIPVAIAGAIGLILGLLMTFWDTISGWLQNGIDWLWGKAEWLSSKGEFLLSTILVVAAGIVNTIKGLFNGLFTSVKQILDGILLIFKGQFAEGFTSIGKGIGNVFITILNTVINLINAVWTALLNLVDAAGSLFGKDWNLKSRLQIPTIPLLAKGGILNNPGKGVFTGSAIAGEAGKEFYMPLEDEQMLRLVGQSIGKYITINASITNTMNGRVISKALKQIQNEDDFAYNR